MLTEIKPLPVKGHTMVPPDRIVGLLDSCYIRKQWNPSIGRVAQLGERGVRNAEVEGSNPFASTRVIARRPLRLGSSA